MARYTLCPFYLWEARCRITCEDIYRHFDSLTEKYAWMDIYCDRNWEACPYARDLLRAYDQLEKGDVMALENQKIEALQKELHSLSTKLGRAQKKIQKMKDVNNSLVRVNESLHRQKRDLYNKWREAESNTDAAKMSELTQTVMDQADKVLKLYKQVACYLLEKAGGLVYEEEVKAWAEGKICTIYREYDDTGRLVWQVASADIPEEETKENEDAKDAEKDRE